MNLDWSGRELDDLAVTCQIIGSLALDLDRGIPRRDLLDHAGELREQGTDRTRQRPGIAGLDHAALAVVGITLLTPTHHEAVALAAVHHERNGLGGFA